VVFVDTNFLALHGKAVTVQRGELQWLFEDTEFPFGTTGTEGAGSGEGAERGSKTPISINSNWGGEDCMQS